MKTFLNRHATKILGVLNGFDRLIFRGALRALCHLPGVIGFLQHRGLKIEQFTQFAKDITDRIHKAADRWAFKSRVTADYLNSPKLSKEQYARLILDVDGFTEGPVCLFSAVEPCKTVKLVRPRDGADSYLRHHLTRCLHYYFYLIDKRFGLMHVRVQTYWPFSVQIWINGREYLARQMDQAGIQYHREDNAFTWIENFPRAQRLMDNLLRTRWTRTLRRATRAVHPVYTRLVAGTPIDYFWSAYQTEWATDIAFESAEALAPLYSAMLHQGMAHLGSWDVLRYLGRPVNRLYKGQVISDIKQRPEGLRIKHSAGRNSIKVYDKHGSVLRTETTINDPYAIKVSRPKDGEPDGPRAQRPMRKGVADLHRRSQVSQAANERYIEAMAGVEIQCPAADLLTTCLRRAQLGSRHFRGLRPLDPQDRSLIQASSRGEFTINGFRNRDIRALLYPSEARTKRERTRRTARVSRLLAMLRAHRLIRKIPHTHRYQVTARGREVFDTVIRLNSVSANRLREVA
jgi:hypothetical protein